jgi:hypothetical protein
MPEPNEFQIGVVLDTYFATGLLGSDQRSMDDKTDVNLPKQGIEYIMRVEKHVSEPWFSDPASVKRWREAV